VIFAALSSAILLSIAEHGKYHNKISQSCSKALISFTELHASVNEPLDGVAKLKHQEMQAVME